MAKKVGCLLCDGTRVVKEDDGEMTPCPALSVTALGRLACKLPDGTFDAKAEHRSILNARMQKDKAYEERNKVVAALARYIVAHGGVAGIRVTKIKDWNPEWFNCLYIELPNGKQVSWHLHDSHLPIFEGLPVYSGEWDGHDTPTKYKRLEEWSKEWKP